MRRLISEVINERKVWMIISTRKEDCEEEELEIIKPIIEKLNEQWFEKDNLVWAGRLDDEKTSIAVFEATEEKAKNFFEQYHAVCENALNVKLHQWDAFPLFTILERMQGRL